MSLNGACTALYHQELWNVCAFFKVFTTPFIVMQFSCVANNIPNYISIVFHFRFSLKNSVPPIMHIVMDHPVG